MKRSFFFLFTLFIFVSSCKNKKPASDVKNDVLLAEIKGNTLHLSDVPPFLLKSLSDQDSIAFLSKYVDSWLKNEVYTLEAIDNISNLNEIEYKTEQYENDLIRASYQESVLKAFEVELTEDELKTFYTKHIDYFKFDEDFYEVKFILLPKSTSNIQQLRKTISENKSSNFLDNYCQQNSDKCHLQNGLLKTKFYLEETLKIPLEDIVISNNYKFHYLDADYVMIYRIVSLKSAGSTAPFIFVKNEVGKMALHNKKQEYLLDLEEKIYQKAKNDKIFKKHMD